jgi:hypothetical protein
MEKILCDENKEYIHKENATCNIKLISREKTIINVYQKLKKDLPDVMVNLNFEYL